MADGDDTEEVEGELDNVEGDQSKAGAIVLHHGA